MCRDELDYKSKIGKEFLPLSAKRLQAIKSYRFIKAKQEYLISKEKLKDVPDEEKGLSENILLNEKCEEKFFKLLQVLVKNHDENKKKLKRLKDPIEDHKNLLGSDWAELDQIPKDKRSQWDNARIEHINVIKNKIKQLAKIYEN